MPELQPPRAENYKTRIDYFAIEGRDRTHSSGCASKVGGDVGSAIVQQGEWGDGNLHATQHEHFLMEHDKLPFKVRCDGACCALGG